MQHIEFIVTLRCKICGEISSLEVGLGYPESSKAIKDFTDQHEHPDTDKSNYPSPWII